MVIKNNLIEIDENNIFKNDTLEREESMISNDFGSLEDYEQEQYWKNSLELVIKKIEFLDKFNKEFLDE